MSYLAFVVLAAIASWLVARRTSGTLALPPELSRKLRWAALLGALVGAYLCELPADWFGLAPPTADGHARLGGRTLLGALLFGWAAVELYKRKIGYREPTGDAFALPLATALCVGRLGCVVTGCCPGRLIAADSPLARPALWLHGQPRFPAALLEAYFHGLAALLLLFLGAFRPHPRAPTRGRLFAGYLAVYSVLRFWLETERDVPHPFWGLSYYQLLALVLFCLSFATWLARLRPLEQAAALRTPGS